MESEDVPQSNFLAAILNISTPLPPNFFFGKPRLAFPKKKKFDLWTFVTEKVNKKYTLEAWRLGKCKMLLM